MWKGKPEPELGKDKDANHRRHMGVPSPGLQGDCDIMTTCRKRRNDEYKSSSSIIKISKYCTNKACDYFKSTVHKNLIWSSWNSLASEQSKVSKTGSILTGLRANLGLLFT